MQVRRGHRRRKLERSGACAPTALPCRCPALPRGQPQVYACLVEGCGRAFKTIEERKQHLADLHLFPRNYNFDRMHLR